MRLKNLKNAIKNSLSFASCQDQVVCNDLLHCDSEKSRKHYKSECNKFYKNIKYIEKLVYINSLIKMFDSVKIFFEISIKNSLKNYN